MTKGKMRLLMRLYADWVRWRMDEKDELDMDDATVAFVGFILVSDAESDQLR